MLIVDTALKKREQDRNPIKVGLLGAGFIAKGVAIQISNCVPGMEVVAISNRTVAKAENIFYDCGIREVTCVSSARAMSEAIRRGQRTVTDDPHVLCETNEVDAIIELTGNVEFGAETMLAAIRGGKDVVVNAELDATIGPILKHHADTAGVVYTNCDGDQPGVIMNLFRWVQSIGFRPVLAGNIKGMLDHTRTPATQARFAHENGQTAHMATNFVDGTKLAMEMCTVSNATGFKVGIRGMYGPRCKHVDEASSLFPPDQMLERGLVDYVIGAAPEPGVFIIGHTENPHKQSAMKYFKRGDGPFYVFYTPYHFPDIEPPISVARAVLFRDATIAPCGPPSCEVITIAKRDLKAGEQLDGIGGYCAYGMLENSEVARQDDLLPMGLSEDCILQVDIAKDQAVRYGDVKYPSHKIHYKLRREQDQLFDCIHGRQNDKRITTTRGEDLIHPKDYTHE